MNKLKLSTIALLALTATGVAGMSGCAQTHASESTGQYVDSSAITAKVKAQLLADDYIKSFPITVNTYNDVVQLSGFVESEFQRTRAAEIAAQVKGVRAVENALVVRAR